MSVLRITASLLNSWLYATDNEAPEGSYERFLATLERAKELKSKAMLEGTAFEEAINEYVTAGTLPEPPLAHTVRAMGDRLKGGQLQVRAEKILHIAGVDTFLVGIADCLKAGIISDIKRVQRYEYGKYQHSAQHPMYMELFPEALRFDYLIFDGSYSYMEQYRRGGLPSRGADNQRVLRLPSRCGIVGYLSEKLEGNGVKITSTESQQLMAEGDYEVQCVRCEEGLTKTTYRPVINFDFVVRKDVEQPYGGKHVFKNFYQDEDTKEWPKDKIGRYANAPGIPKGQEVDISDLVGLCCMIRIKHYDGNDGIKRESILFTAPSKAAPAIQATPGSLGYETVEDEELPF